MQSLTGRRSPRTTWGTTRLQCFFLSTIGTNSRDKPSVAIHKLGEGGKNAAGCTNGCGELVNCVSDNRFITRQSSAKDARTGIGGQSHCFFNKVSQEKRWDQLDTNKVWLQ